MDEIPSFDRLRPFLEVLERPEKNPINPQEDSHGDHESSKGEEDKIFQVLPGDVMPHLIEGEREDKGADHFFLISMAAMALWFVDQRDDMGRHLRIMKALVKMDRDSRPEGLLDPRFGRALFFSKDLLPLCAENPQSRNFLIGSISIEGV